MSSVGKSPTHASALRLRDVTPGRRVALVSTARGVLDTITITERPRTGFAELLGANTRVLWVVGNGSQGEIAHFATDCGVIPYDSELGKWNPYNFLIDVRKLHTLPELVEFENETHRVTHGFFDRYAQWASD